MSPKNNKKIHKIQEYLPALMSEEYITKTSEVRSLNQKFFFKKLKKRPTILKKATVLIKTDGLTSLWSRDKKTRRLRSYTETVRSVFLGCRTGKTTVFQDRYPSLSRC
jgi:hypothetical protein